ncbi:MAG: formimidoylglutamate deiminase [Silvibacterium sp.]
MNTLYRPELLYSNGKFISNAGVLVGESGKVLETPENVDESSTQIVDLPGKALLPGFVNAHSHSFQRLIRGKSESRIASGRDFWSWRGTMYHAARQLDSQEVYDVARMAFLEMVLAGITTVGEFHYLHNAPNGSPYEDPNLLSKQVIAAAQSVGLRIVLLRTAYLRSGFELPRDPGQIRFFESRRAFLENASALMREYPDASQVRFGVAPHSIRAVPLADLREIAAWSRTSSVPFHMHVSEQVAENAACVREYGLTPVELLNREQILGPDFTAVHAIHITPAEINMLAGAEATICSCPTTERNLGDGIFPADRVMAAGIRIALGSDSQAQIDPLEDARQLDYHLRLQQQERAILDQIAATPLAKNLFECATIHGGRSLAVPAGELKPGTCADFFTVDLNDIAIAGHSADDLLPIIVFSLNRSAIRDVVVNGKIVIQDQKHKHQDEIISRYKEVHRKTWLNSRVREAHP